MARHGQMGDVAPAFVVAGWARVLGRELRTHDEVVISRLEEQSCEVAEMQARCTQMHPDAIRCTQMHPDTPRLQREEEEGTAP